MMHRASTAHAGRAARAAVSATCRSNSRNSSSSLFALLSTATKGQQQEQRRWMIRHQRQFAARNPTGGGHPCFSTTAANATSTTKKKATSAPAVTPLAAAVPKATTIVKIRATMDMPGAYNVNSRVFSSSQDGGDGATAPAIETRTMLVEDIEGADAAARPYGSHIRTETTFNLPDPADRAHDVGYRSPPLQCTKIVATIGPTSEQEGPLYDVTKAGMSIMRLNFSHATKDEVELRTKNLALAQDALSKVADLQESQDVRAILLDTKGPEIRTGKLANDFSGHETISLKAGENITLRTDPGIRDEGSTESDLYIDYPNLHRAVQPGRKVLLDDGAIVLTVDSVESKKEVHGKVVCTVDNTGDLRSRAGVNLPLADTSDLPAMSDKDRADIKYGMSAADVDYIAASFVQSGDGVREIRRYVSECARELGWDACRPLPLIVSKIETAGALQHFDDILYESDGIMVARGDLGVEIPLTQVTNAQKEMIAACNTVGKPVIVATQMLESMAKNPRPTRAEVSDVSNAVYDGADCVMLSGETAKGKFPTVAVRTMNEIILASERYASSLGSLGHPVKHPFIGPKTDDAAIAKAAVTAAAERECCAILVLTNHGTLPRLVSAYRPDVPIFAFCPSAKIGRQLQIYRGVHPIVGLHGVSPSKRPEHAVDDTRKLGYVRSGDEVVIVSMEDGSMGRTATMNIAVVP